MEMLSGETDESGIKLLTEEGFTVRDWEKQFTKGEEVKRERGQ
jgi:hypothetical protein